MQIEDVVHETKYSSAFLTSLGSEWVRNKDEVQTNEYKI